MSYTPKFQEVLDKCTALLEQSRGVATPEIQEFFKESIRNLGPYERINNLYRIRPKRPVPGERSRLQFFKFNKSQEYIWKNRSNRDLILKPRQAGITTMSCIRALDRCLWEDGINTAIMAHVLPNVRIYFRIIKTAFRAFQTDWGSIYPVTNIVDNVNELALKETGSTLRVCVETKGLTLDFLHISEACFVEDARISESLESVPLTGEVVMESTPNTASGMFYEIWDMWSRGEASTFKGIFFPWWVSYPEEEDLPHLKPNGKFTYTDKELLLVEQHDLTPEHILWRRLKLSEAGGDEGEFNRKYPEDPQTCFLSGSNSVFPPQILASLYKLQRLPAFVGELTMK